jgi:hypothetical protein
MEGSRWCVAPRSGRAARQLTLKPAWLPNSNPREPIEGAATASKSGSPMPKVGRGIAGEQSADHELRSRGT